jgi:fumarylacetoacetase
MDPTTDPHLRSFVDVAPNSDFPIQNLPYGVFAPAPAEPPRVGVAIGDFVLDLALIEQRGLLGRAAGRPADVFQHATLNPFMALGPTVWNTTRAAIQRLLRHDVAELRDDGALRDLALVPLADATLHLPCMIGDFTDFYTSLNHARNVSRLFRGPDADAPAAFRHQPLGYHGRASSIVISGTPIARPRGTYRAPDESVTFGPTQQLDFELEFGALIGHGNALGHGLSVARAANHVFGFVLVNDWSARDIQQWEYHPLGPFNGKNFATTISPWVVPAAALAPFRCPTPPQEPPPLPHLQAAGDFAYDLNLTVTLRSAACDTEVVITETNFREQYWTLAQMIAHHTAGGCNLRPGDLVASGTVSGPTPEAVGCLLERTRRGETPVEIADDLQRVFLEDGDEILLHGWSASDGYRVGFGECTGRVTPAI